MKKHATLRMILLAVVVTLAIGMTTTVFATEQVQSDEVITEQPSVGEVTISGLPKTETLVSEYMMTKAEEELGEEQPLKYPRRSRLNEASQVVYDILLSEIRKVASGERESTVIKIPLTEFMEIREYTAEELEVSKIAENGQITEEAADALEKTIEVDMSNTVKALVSDVPYELYWYDKTIGCYFRMPGPMATIYSAGYSHLDTIYFADDAALCFEFSVSNDYLPDGESDGYTVDKNLTADTVEAAQTAAGIVADAVNKSDIERLETYRNEICERVEYNNGVMQDQTTPYGDPWQLVYVFDGDSTTNVVCEGYSKAFKFLCDITGQNDLFINKKLDSYLVSGPMSYEYQGDIKSGPHMWNIVTMGDYENYLVDVTNCDVDDDEIVCTSDYFLKGDPNGNASGYTVEGLTYAYDEDTNAIYETAELTIAKADYDPGTDPGTGPGTDPGTGPGTDPGTGPGTDPGTDPGGDDPEPVVQSIEKAMVAGITNRTYSGGAQTQPLVVKLDGATLTAGKDYEVAYANNTNVGRATVTITGIGAYEGKLVRTFDINPQGTTIKSLKKAKKKFTVKWNKQANQTSGYQIQYCLKSNFKSGVKTVTIGNNKTVSRKVTKLKKKKTYYVKIRTYSNVGGATYYSGWSPVKKVKTK